MKTFLISMTIAPLLCLTSLALSETITVTALNHDYHEAPVHVTVTFPPSAGFVDVALFDGNAIVPVQTKMMGGKLDVAWIVHDLKKGDSIRYRLAWERQARGVPASGVIVDRVGTEDLNIRINNEFFTRYDTRTGPNKPYFYPIFGPGNKRMTRRYGIETVAGETHDHPHHRGLWFTHGAVNGEDYWSEGGVTAKTVNTKFDEITSGSVYGHFRAHTDWINHAGKKVAEDVRDVTVYNVADGRMMDFDVTMKAIGGPLVFGDTKEGSFGIRLPDSMRVAGGDGHIEMSTGVKDAATWGKKADWVDYYGTTEGEVEGVAILDNPKNLRHPTTWHVRDYGLFAANPFGLHDFNNDKAHPNLGDHTVPENGTITWRYRVFFHKGSTADAHIADVWNAYTDPPKVEVR
jgi:hypothetical protein